jgi:hypothetical protein
VRVSSLGAAVTGAADEAVPESVDRASAPADAATAQAAEASTAWRSRRP